MMKRLVSTILLLSLVSSLLLLFSSCKNQSKFQVCDSGAYSFSVFEIPDKVGYDSYLQGIFPDENGICIPVVYTQYDSNGMILDQVTDIITIDDKGNTKKTLEVMGNQPPIAVLENEYAYLGYKNEEIEQSNGNLRDPQRIAVFLDKSSGDVVRTIETSFVPYYIVPISDGFVIGGYSTVSRYTKDGRLLKTLDLGFTSLLGCECFFEDDSRFYIIEENDMDSIIYHEVDFESGIGPAIASNKDIGIIGMNIEGKYFFNPDGEYRVNLSGMQVDCLADWNSIDIRPPRKQLDTPSRYHRLDDERFAISYQYRDKTSEVLVFCYDPAIDRSNVETIKIGGFNIFSDPVLQWAVYNFNITHKDYRVVLEEYGYRFDKYSPEQGHTGKLELTQYFSEGHTPDIFYGTRFDYSYMGRSGMVEDLSGFINSQDASMLELTDTARKLFSGADSKCYQIFAGYILYGYSIQENVWNSVDNTSVFSLYDYAQEHSLPYSVSSAADIVDSAIRYNFTDLWGAYDGIKKISSEELLKLVTVALSTPRSEMGYASEEDVLYGKSIMSNTAIFCDLSEINDVDNRFHFIGYPSVHDSVYLAHPECCCAISSTAKNKAVCWEMLALLLSEDAQKQVLYSGYIPATQYMLDLFCEMSMHPESTKDKDLISYWRNREPVSQVIIDIFLDNALRANTIETQDYGIYDIICDEISSYYSQNRSPEQITKTLDQRLTLYCQENYQ